MSTISFVWRSINMIYVLCYYLIAAVRLGCSLLWTLFQLIGAGIPWLLATLVVAWFAAKWVRMKKPPGYCRDAGDWTPLAKRMQVTKGQVMQAEEKSTDGEALYWPVAERGADLDAPENSVAALKMCHSKRCPTVLLDLALTGCRQLVILHKDAIATANVDVAATKLADLRDINITRHHALHAHYAAEPILTLAELMRQLSEASNSGGQLAGIATVFLRLPNNPKPGLMEALAASIAGNEQLFRDRIVVCCDTMYKLYMLRSKFEFLVCALWAHKLSADLQCGGCLGSVRRLLMAPYAMFSMLCATLRHLQAQVMGISVVFLHKDEFNDSIRQSWLAIGVRPIVYSVNSPNEKLFYQRNLRTQYLTGSLRTEPQHLLRRAKGE